MKKTLRILTTVHMANHGACIFIYSLQQALARILPEFEVRILDYLPRNRYYHELARALKPQKGALSHNLGRYIQSERFHRHHLKLDRPTVLYPAGYRGMTRFLADRRYDALITAMVVWDISDQAYLPRFPSIYWLSEEIPSVKIAYATSGHRSKDGLVKKHLPAIQRILSSYALIGVRDQLTWEIVHASRADECVPVLRVPDPAFLYQPEPTDVRQVLAAHGIDLQRPILGILFYGKPELSEALCSHYHSLGFQTLAMSMYNPHADFNLGHVLTPFEWAEAFRYLSFCITDRFHGTVFCLRNNIPFLSIEPYAPETPKNSKILSLLDDFALSECYVDVYREGLRLGNLLSYAEVLRLAWQKDFAPRVADKLEATNVRNQDFLQLIQSALQ